ncbi:hypothetical protein [Kordiimonas laminariae]|uniref:hypothetical protein n=1 Tax=Kordiimonas laminariae TaxID=2917717 RepID=UPI001FF1A496|nr:hypothetical protein [Kordiimonas laminariae]MCK0068812.1 hypothetical protein [Kordiimonas laminariae]
MRIVKKAEIEEALKSADVFSAIKNAFIQFSVGDVTTPPVGYLSFPEANGDLHIKFGHTKGDEVFVIKLSTGFYDNLSKGLPSSNGLMMILSAITGEPLALLEDGGMLTDIRTAVAGALASDLLKPNSSPRVGVIGTGIQARLQVQYLSKLLPEATYSVWGRDKDKTATYIADMAKAGLYVEIMSSPEDLCRSANIIISTTPSTSPIIKAEWIKAGTHITAVGADAPGKQELEANLFQKATFVAFDSKEQCLHHGEASHSPVEFKKRNSAELGTVFKEPDIFTRKKSDITIADLTGIAAQDIAIAKAVWSRLAP